MQDTTKNPISIKDFASLGGKARAAQSTIEEKRAQAALARSSRKCFQNVAKATHSGILHIGDKEIACAVLEDGTRVITQRTLEKVIGRGRTSSKKADNGANLPVFIESDSLKPFITSSLIGGANPIKFTLPTSGVLAYGFKAEFLPEVCELYLKARDAGVLAYNQKHIAEECDIIMRALAKVGITALIDESTGYQVDRERDALQKILTKYLSQELLPWTRRFSNAFFNSYKKMYACDMEKQCPAHVGHFINKYVYDELAPGVLQELKQRNPTDENGRRHSCHHQWLSGDTGVPALDKQLLRVTTLMKISRDKKSFEEFYAVVREPAEADEEQKAVDAVEEKC